MIVNNVYQTHTNTIFWSRGCSEGRRVLTSSSLSDLETPKSGVTLFATPLGLMNDKLGPSYKWTPFHSVPLGLVCSARFSFKERSVDQLHWVRSDLHVLCEQCSSRLTCSDFAVPDWNFQWTLFTSSFCSPIIGEKSHELLELESSYPSNHRVSTEALYYRQPKGQLIPN